MEKEMDGEQVIVKISDGEGKLISNYRNEEIEVEAEAMEKQDPAGLRLRKKILSSSRSSSTIEIPKNNVITAMQVNDPESLFPEANSTASPSEKSKTRAATPPITPPLMVSPRVEDDDDDDDDDDDYKVDDDFETYTKVNHIRKQTKKTKLLEFSLFVCITLVLILSNTINNLKNIEIWSLKLWKWCILVLAFFCGRLFSEWFVNLVLFMMSFLIRKKVLYFVNELQKGVINFFWLGLILLTWGLLINRGVYRSRRTTKVLNYITRGIASTLVVYGVWILKVLFVKNLYSSFHVNLFFDRIQESIFHQYVIETLSGPPLMEDSKSSPKENGKQKKENAIDRQNLQNMKSEMVSAWTMIVLMDVISRSGLSIPEDDAEPFEQKFESLTSETQAQNAGYVIFNNVAKHNHKYIEEDDLLRFMDKYEVELVLPMFQGAVDTGKIKKKSISNWVVNVYKERRRLALSLQDTKAVVDQLDRFITGLTVAALIILWLIIMGIATTEVLLFISSQFILAIFSFGATAKSTLEAVIFVFVRHPFDVGDRCVIDGVQVVVKEVSILTTVFLRYDNEKIYYPNSLLATKAISNFSRSRDMSDCVDFDLDASTSDDNILALKAKIKTYIDSKPKFWRSKHNYMVREVEGVDKMKMSLHLTHTINFQNYKEISHRRTLLMLKLKKIFEELGIKYHLHPIRSSNSATTTTLQS